MRRLFHIVMETLQPFLGLTGKLITDVDIERCPV